VQEYNPDEELIRWITTNIQLSYYEYLLDYPMHHQKLNKLTETRKVDESYYDFIESIPAIHKESLIYADSRWFINRYFMYIWDIGGRRADSSITASNIDSFIIEKIIEFSPEDGLVKQLVLNEFVNNQLTHYEVALYENFKATIHEVITENYLIEPLDDHYNQIKSYLEAPIPDEKVKIHEQTGGGGSDLWAEILNKGKNKVIYIDCWGTWCTPCLAEFPHSIRLMKAYKNKDINFVFLCFSSKEEPWKAMVAGKKLKGTHYLLNDMIADYFKDLFNISGLPTYVIVDRDGNIVRSGSLFRPSNPVVREIIDGLL
jgi:thiol-disulfide isomerase/thioredoxin